MIARGSRGLSSFATAAFRLDTSTQRVHEIDGLRRLALARRLDRLAGLFLLSSSFKVLVAILEATHTFAP